MPPELLIPSLLRAYPWFDHPEGMKFAELFRDAHRSAGHWLFLAGSISAFHRVMNCEEVWAIHSGRLLLHVAGPDGVVRTLRLGLDVDRGEFPVATVPRGAWQAAELPADAPHAFGTNLCAPAFDYAELQIAQRETLLAELPGAGDLVRRLTLPRK